MAYTLKSSGLATDLLFCVAIDDDGSIKEFVSSTVNSNKTIDSGVSTGTSTWKGTSRGYFQTASNGAFNFHGIRFASGFRPAFNIGFGSPRAIFFACASMDAGTGTPNILATQFGDFYWRSGTNKLTIVNSSYAGTTSLPSDGTTKFSAGSNYDNSVDWEHFYGLESGSLATDGSGSEGGFGGSIDIASVGGADGGGSQPGKYHIVCGFDRNLTTGEFQSLHGNGTNDWFTTLFDAAQPTLTGSSMTGGHGTSTPNFQIAL